MVWFFLLLFGGGVAVAAASKKKPGAFESIPEGLGLSGGPAQPVYVDPDWGKPPPPGPQAGSWEPVADPFQGTSFSHAASEVDVGTNDVKMMDTLVARLGDTDVSFYVHVCLVDWPTIANSPFPYFAHSGQVYRIDGRHGDWEVSSQPWNKTGCPTAQTKRPDWPAMGDAIGETFEVEFFEFGRELHARIWVGDDHPRRYRMWARGRQTAPGA